MLITDDGKQFALYENRGRELVKGTRIQVRAEPSLLRTQVTSKGGTTERAIAVLNDAAVKSVIVAAVKAAAARAKELGDQHGGEA